MFDEEEISCLFEASSQVGPGKDDFKLLISLPQPPPPRQSRLGHQEEAESPSTLSGMPPSVCPSPWRQWMGRALQRM